MPQYQIAFNLATYVATIQAKGDVLPNGSKNIGEFYHEHTSDPLGNNPVDGSLGENHVFWHHIREALYKTSAVTGNRITGSLVFPNNITDMERVTLAVDSDFIPLTSIAVTPSGTSTLTVAAPTVQLGITKTPGNATNGNVTYVSSAPNIATVSATGLVTRVANGSAVITATSVDGAKTDTKAITCTA